MDSDKSIGASGIAIPNWMKQKIGDRYDLDDSSAFSPPSQDETFFYIRYPKTTARPQSQTNYHKINKYLEAQQQSETVASTAAMSTKRAPVENITTSSGFPKSIASQMPPQMNTNLDIEFDPEQPPPNLSHRRGSKSLPTSPLSSPKSSRKALQNRYFTAAFSTPEPSSAAGYSGWILNSLLGPREHPVEPALPPISESPSSSVAVAPPPPAASAQLAVPEKGLRKVKSAAALSDDDEKDGEKKKLPIQPILAEAKKIQAYKPKPSELRELNFWSPTSM
ncbi:Hypothetical predicted protein [Cloeon dipterum]|uniref:Uncharacterized protein n=1 Tax=Cloeon dipterum TaxID=197152 RepID=A0A8S1CL57_9INSE|nr:Hypothetical predicted protein [Cloeon dipterum]